MTESEAYLEKALSAAFALTDGDGPAVGPAASARPAKAAPLPDRIGRYPVEALIGRGGIGLVLKARDTDLDRAIAVKILHDHLASDAEMVRRFVEEAQIGGSLEHPGVVPVHEMGRTEDGRPYFTMKLVEGETFAAGLAARTNVAEDRLGFLSTFETVCQIVAYAHARDIVHLDLKPTNVLVGGFGEILVTDWGFASQLSGRAAKPGAPARIAGTPAYMSPEQARGELGRIGCRSDVFALGSMLCEILTGAPAYEGESASEILLAASRAWLDGASKRLDGCTADSALIALVRRCLAPDPADRPADAGEVANAIGRHLRSLDERAQALAIEAAEARARAEAERRQRRLVVALTGAGILAVVLGCGAWLWIERDHAARAREDDRVAAGMEERVRLLAERARAAPEPDPGLWEAPWATARQADEFARTRALSADMRGRIEKLVAATNAERAAAAEGAGILERLMAIHERFGDTREAALKDEDYAETFRRAGIDVDALSPAETAARVAASPLRPHLIEALDEWAQARRSVRGAEASAALIEIANRVDSDRWRAKVRAAVTANDVPALEALAAAPERESESVESQIMLARSLMRAGKIDLAVSLLEGMGRRHPGEYRVQHELGVLRRELAKGDLTEAIRRFSMALALRPRSAHAFVDLGQVLLQADKDAAAEPLLEEARGLEPAYAPAWHYLGMLRWRQWDAQEAARLFAKSIELDPGAGMSHGMFAVALRAIGRIDEATAAYRVWVERDPGYAERVCDLGTVLVEQGRFAEGREYLQKGHDLGKARGNRWKHPSAQLIDRADRFIADEQEIAEEGSDLAAGDLADVFSLAEPALLLGRARTAARIMDRALSSPRALANAPLTIQLFAARAAAAAGSGVGSEPVDAAEAATWRKRSQQWLEAALDSLEDTEVADPRRAEAGRMVETAALEPGFAGVRERDRLATLPSEESKAWTALWERARRLVQTSRGR